MFLASSLIEWAAGAFPFLRRPLSRAAVKFYATRTAPRPRPFSLWSPLPMPGDRPGPITDYTSWPALTDETFTGRHLPPASQAYIDSLPADDSDPATGRWGAPTLLFQRGAQMRSSRSSALFMFFAQWFTDSVLRTDPVDRRKNTSNHDIDLCQIYGLTEQTARLLRSKAGGRLKSQTLADGGEYLPYLLEQGPDGLRIKPEFEGLISMETVNRVFQGVDEARKARAYATGLERGNSSIGYVALNTLFLREHNRICGELARSPETQGWDDERLFQTARAINIVVLMRLVIDEYINHINGYRLFQLDNSYAEDESWCRPNWVALEFNLLYRWHGLVPDTLRIANRDVPASEYRHNNTLFEQYGFEQVISAASSAPAGRISLKNTPDFLLAAEHQSLKMGRDFRLASFNDYREEFKLARLTRFDQLTGDVALQQELERLYGDIDKVELVVGLFAEDPSGDLLFGDLMKHMVAYDAFTHIFSNPLLARRVYNKATFTDVGLSIIRSTTSLEAFINRNTRHTTRASFDAPPGNVVALQPRGSEPGAALKAAE